MSEEKSRVVLYAKLRKKIESTGTYSFSDNETTKKHLPQYSSTSVDLKDDSFKPKIKKNTLSLTIDELIREHEQYNSKEQQKEIKRRYSARNKESKSDSDKIIKVIWGIVIFLGIASIAAITVFLIMKFRGN